MAMNLYEMQETLPALSAALKAAGEPSRLRILKVLEEGELCVCHLVSLLGVTQPTVSRHIAILKFAGLVEERKDGRWTHYRRSSAAPFLGVLLETISRFAEEDPQVLEDRRRAAEFRKTPISEFCGSVKRGR